ncbi:hypothetical protein [Roseovarius rhodophyticola]|uniref:Uncharacterized protein n=1 Tax=Roseovarius rhodophyticola TaxID=3080827 RepID=A0ABZ2THE1_9RHOB|nr:hypothetical protein [Roseovarius sp. W115]MDV2928077.1 hypothetical protein [Roseovarius sp. W115]
MHDFEEFDWMHASKAERVEPTKKLFLALKAVSDITGRAVDLLMDDAYGTPNTTSPHYASNFRRGNIAAGKALMIHRWLEENHFEIAKTAAPELFQFNPKSAWQQFVDRHAIKGQLRILKLKDSMGLIERDDEDRPDRDTLRLTQRFCFELETEMIGRVLAFQKYQNKWHNFPLGADQRNLWGRVASNPQLLPCAPDGSPIALKENNDAGDHQFAMIVSDAQKLPSEMRQLAKLDLESQAFELHVVAVTIVT